MNTLKQFVQNNLPLYYQVVFIIALIGIALYFFIQRYKWLKELRKTSGIYKPSVDYVKRITWLVIACIALTFAYFTINGLITLIHSLTK